MPIADWSAINVSSSNTTRLSELAATRSARQRSASRLDWRFEVSSTAPSVTAALVTQLPTTIPTCPQSAIAHDDRSTARIIGTVYPVTRAISSSVSPARCAITIAFADASRAHREGGPRQPPSRRRARVPTATCS